VLDSQSEMARLYAEGFSCETVGKRLGFSHSCVARTLRRLGLSTRTRGEIVAKRNRATAKASDAELLALHKQGILPADIAQRCGMEAQNVRQRLRGLGVRFSKSVGLKAAYAAGRRRKPIGSVGENGGEKVGGNKGRKYTIDETAFETELTPAKAWLLGVIVGDGCVTRRAGKINGLMVCGDRDVCEKAATILGSNAPVKYLKVGCWDVQFHNPQLGESLARYGILPAKTYDVPFPDLAPPSHTSLYSWILGCRWLRHHQKRLQRATSIGSYCCFLQ